MADDAVAPQPKGPSWQSRIDTARVTGQFTPDDIEAAGSWVRCALGEHHASTGRLFRDSGVMMDDPPIVQEAHDLGYEFCLDVTANRIEEAQGVLREIIALGKELDDAVDP